ncbi:MAG: glycosyltransferase family 4 protein [Vicinamibacteria bacterium]|jgi:glycosyltransferase involved in cell wall biosynthesis|nr:glycosyltransferase family 4 protein [Vicinamibacteria bacterium]
MERAVYHLAVHLQQAGIQTVLLTRPGVNTQDFPGAVETFAYRAWAGLAHGRVLDRLLNYPAFAWRVGRRALELTESGRVDLVHAHGLAGWGYARLRRRATRQTPWVLNPHGMEEHKTRGFKRLLLTSLRRKSRETARAATRVIATDRSMRAEVEQLLAVDAQRIAVIPNGVDLDEIARLTPADLPAALQELHPALNGAELRILSVGRIEEYKGFFDILQVLARLQREQRLPAAWRWIVAGEGSLRANLARRAQEILPARVFLTGPISDRQLHALYAAADLFVHAPWAEGSSLVTLEALAHGLPVVATRVGGIPDKIEDGVSGRLVAPRDGDALALALAALTHDAAARQRMGAAGRARVAEQFTWPGIARQTIALYEDLLRGRAA